MANHIFIKSVKQFFPRYTIDWFQVLGIAFFSSLTSNRVSKSYEKRFQDIEEML